jgi:hypothetical protein
MPNLEQHTYHSPTFEGIVNDAINFFTLSPVIDLPPTFSFNGSGVYGLYYIGDYELYEPISKKNQQSMNYPIYIGKAVPEGWRTARAVLAKSPVLYRRLNEHSRNIEQSENLNLNDFRCRFIILYGIESDLVVPIEAELIRKYTPLWNSFIDGFGNHDPGSGRYNQSMSEWDTIHPGRGWVVKLTGKPPKTDEIKNKIKSFLEL